MNHFIYPHEFSHGSITAPKIAEPAIKKLYSIIISHGSAHEDLIVFLAGGSVINTLNPYISTENIKAAKKVLKELKLHPKITETGGNKGKKIYFNNFTGEFRAETIK